MKLNKFTQTAIEAALIGGKILKNYYQKKIKVDFKGLIDPVTEADRSSQEIIIKFIKKRFPEHTFLAEEGDKTAYCAEYCWIIDPLDGTVNFIHGIPIFCVSVGLMSKGEIIAGAVHAPVLGETFAAEKGKGAWLNGRKIKVSKTDSLVRALAVTGFSYNIHSKSDSAIKYLENVLTNVQGVRRLGSAALDLSYVANGRFEAFWEEGLSPWDVAAGSLILSEAGGKVSDLRNSDDFIFGKSILGSNGILHERFLELIRAT